MKVTINQIAQVAAELMIHMGEYGTPDAVEIEEGTDGAISMSLSYESMYTELYTIAEDGTFDSQTIEHAD